MIESNNILLVGPEYKKPKGGIAQVLNSCSLYVYKEVKHITSNGGNSICSKLFTFGKGLFSCVLKLLFDRTITIVHIHTASNNDFKRNSYFIRIAKLFNKKVVLHIHGGGFKDYYSHNKKFVRQQLDNVDAIIALSEYWQRFFSEDLGYENVFVVHNIIPPPNYIPQDKEEKVFDLLYLGHIYEKKGIFDLVDLIKEHRNEYVGRLRLHIGGGLFEIEKLLKILETEKLDDVITYEGWVSGKKKENLLNMADAYILPSYAEGVPISILEAMSYHLPIISTMVGGIPSIVNDNNGILIVPGNKSQMKKAIDKLMSSASLKRKMGEASYKMSLSYQPHSVIRELECVYNKI